MTTSKDEARTSDKSGSSTTTCDWLITNVSLATMADNGNPYGTVVDGALAILEGEILYSGPASELPEIHADQVIDGEGLWLTPGLVDCHTHTVYGGNRAEEFEWRLNGESYESIAKKGGGIVSSVRQTREATEDELFVSAAKRAIRLLEEGVTTLEIKSGYGLDLENEIKMLKVAKRLGEELPVTVSKTFLGAHALPIEYKEKGSDAYIDLVCEKMIPEVAKLDLAEAVDVFCEGIGFSPDQTERVFKTAQENGLKIKAHVEQLSDLKGAKLAANYQALSVDHLEYLAEEDVAALKENGTVAVLLPGAFYFLNETKLPPIETLRNQNVPMAVATDLNPGTSPMASLLTAINQACVLFGLTPEESLMGATKFGAKALGLNNKGTLEAGQDADVLLWDIKHPSELAYGMNLIRPAAVWQDGQLVRKPN